MTALPDIPERLAAVRQRIGRAAARAGRSAGDVRLVAVSKTFDLEYVRRAAAAGQIDFGENRVQEAHQKIEASRDLSPVWHLIGTLQSNKVRLAVSLFDWIHSVTSVDLLERIDRASAELGRRPRVLVQVDLAGEATKHGAPPAVVPGIFDRARSCQAVDVTGLMVLPPWSENPEAARPYFAGLRELAERLRASDVPAAMLGELSMGMSHDFEVAIEEGATVVRVGTAIFGGRAPKHR